MASWQYRAVARTHFCTLKLVSPCVLILTVQLERPDVYRIEDDQKWMKLVNDYDNAFGQHTTLPPNRKITDITVSPREGEEYVRLAAVRVTYSPLDSVFNHLNSGRPKEMTHI